MIRLNLVLSSEHADQQTRPELAIETGPKTSNRRLRARRVGGRKIRLEVEEEEQP